MAEKFDSVYSGVIWTASLVLAFFIIAAGLGVGGLWNAEPFFLWRVWIGVAALLAILFFVALFLEALGLDLAGLPRSNPWQHRETHLTMILTACNGLLLAFTGFMVTAFGPSGSSNIGISMGSMGMWSCGLLWIGMLVNLFRWRWKNAKAASKLDQST